MVIFKSGSPIKLESRIISIVDFQVDGVNAHLASLLFEIFYGSFAVTATAVSSIDVEFVDERIMAMEFKAEPNRQDDVTDRDRAFGEYPDPAKSRQGQELAQRRPRGSFVKVDLARLLLRERLHHGQKHRFVLKRCFANREFRHLLTALFD